MAHSNLLMSLLTGVLATTISVSVLLEEIVLVTSLHQQALTCPTAGSPKTVSLQRELSLLNVLVLLAASPTVYPNMIVPEVQLSHVLFSTAQCFQ